MNEGNLALVMAMTSLPSIYCRRRNAYLRNKWPDWPNRPELNTRGRQADAKLARTLNHGGSLSHFISYNTSFASIQMSIAPESFTSNIRGLCLQIEAEVASLMQRTAASSQSQRPQLERIVEQLKNAVIQALSSRLPALITIEQHTCDRIEDLTEERDDYREKYRRNFAQLQTLQLENDRLKIEAVALSEAYEQLSMAYEELKFKYHSLGQGGDDHRTLTELALLARDSATNSASSDREASEGARTLAETMAIEKEMLAEEVRGLHKEVFGFHARVEELLADQAAVERDNAELQRENAELRRENGELRRENGELGQLLEGEKKRSDRFDRQMLDVLNRNQELKIELLEQRQAALTAHQQREDAEEALSQQRLENAQAATHGQQLAAEIGELKTIVTGLKLENSQLRQSVSELNDRERQHKAKNDELRRENEQLRSELEKLMARLHTATESLDRSRQEEAQRHRSELQAEAVRASLQVKETKAKTHERVQEISKMHREITGKLEQKIHLLQKGNRDKKEKVAALKFEVERLYESLQMQVEKEFKANEKAKELTERAANAEAKLKDSEERLAKSEEARVKLEDAARTAKQEAAKTAGKLKRMLEVKARVAELGLPKIKEELQSLRLVCRHLATTVEMGREQTGFLLSKKQEHLVQLMEQGVLQRSLAREQAQLAHQGDLARWKENCRNYEERYDALKTTHDALLNAHALLEDKNNRLETQHAEAIRDFAERAEGLQEENERRKVEQLSTGKTVEKLREKCREVEQYYKLVDDLSRENQALRAKLEHSQFSFKSPDPLDSTSKRHRPAPNEDSLNRYHKTAAHLGRAGREDISVNDITAKAEFQKMRLEAARREYSLISREP